MENGVGEIEIENVDNRKWESVFEEMGIESDDNKKMIYKRESVVEESETIDKIERIDNRERIFGEIESVQ